MRFRAFGRLENRPPRLPPLVLSSRYTNFRPDSAHSRAFPLLVSDDTASPIHLSLSDASYSDRNCGRKRRSSPSPLSLYDIRRDFLPWSLMASVSFISRLIVDAHRIACRRKHGGRRERAIPVKVRKYSLGLAYSRNFFPCNSSSLTSSS